MLFDPNFLGSANFKVCSMLPPTSSSPKKKKKKKKKKKEKKKVCYLPMDVPPKVHKYEEKIKEISRFIEYSKGEAFIEDFEISGNFLATEVKKACKYSDDGTFLDFNHRTVLDAIDFICSNYTSKGKNVENLIKISDKVNELNNMLQSYDPDERSAAIDLLECWYGEGSKKLNKVFTFIIEFNTKNPKLPKNIKKYLKPIYNFENNTFYEDGLNNLWDNIGDGAGKQYKTLLIKHLRWFQLKYLKSKNQNGRNNAIESFKNLLKTKQHRKQENKKLQKQENISICSTLNFIRTFDVTYEDADLYLLQRLQSIYDPKSKTFDQVGLDNLLYVIKNKLQTYTMQILEHEILNLDKYLNKNSGKLSNDIIKTLAELFEQ